MSVQLARHRFSVEEYHRMAQAGIFSEDDRVELIEGEVVAMSPIGSRHAACVKRLLRLFDRSVGDRAIVSVQDPIRLSERSEPQPDLMLLKPRSDFYGQAHPGPADVLLLIEVAETSADSDRGVKLALYARAGISEVWLVDLERERVELYWNPAPGGYQESRTVGRGERLAPQALPDLDIAGEAVLG
ncbi:MAG: Uma2 family endonuclease [Nitrospira sp.]|jgi:Uma2 family endonuclease|nr:MAG: Uma2 family endonuclease [Nitrospira sp.]